MCTVLVKGIFPFAMEICFRAFALLSGTVNCVAAGVISVNF